MEGRYRRTARLASVAASSKLSASSRKDEPPDAELLEAIQLSLLAEYSKHAVQPPVADAHTVRRKRRGECANNSTSPHEPTDGHLNARPQVDSCSPLVATASVVGAQPAFSPVSTEGHIQQGLLRRRSLTLVQEALVTLQASPEVCLPSRADLPASIESSLQRCGPTAGLRAKHDAWDSERLRSQDTRMTAALVSPLTPGKLSGMGPTMHSQKVEQRLDAQCSQIGVVSPIFESIDSFPSSAPSNAGGFTFDMPRVPCDEDDVLAVAPENFRVLVSQRQANIKAIEDRFFCVPDYMQASDPENVHVQPTTSVSAFVFGIADGHGGDEVAKYVCTVLPNLILRGTRDEVDVLTIQAKIEAAFRTCDENWLRQVPKTPPAARLDPTCPPKSKIGACVVASLVKKMGSSWIMFTANCGDARAILARRKKSATNFVHLLQQSVTGQRLPP
jgi:hypothetical protein